MKRRFNGGIEMKFDWDKFRDIENKIAVHCKTEEEANDFCRKMHNHGMKWCTGRSYLSDNNFKYTRGTCYCNNGTCGSYYHIINIGYTILEWKDYMEKEFTKADLKDGMFVVSRNGNIYIKIGEFLIDHGRWNALTHYTDDLHNMLYSELDIVKVGTLKSGKPLKYIKEEDLDIIWERKEPQKLTPEDAAKKLKELTGEDYEIV